MIYFDKILQKPVKFAIMAVAPLGGFLFLAFARRPFLNTNLTLGRESKDDEESLATKREEKR
jgi:hypothetical protein